MKLLLSALAAAALILEPSFARADEASHRQSAEALLNLMGMESLLSQSIDQMLAMQVKQNPAIAPYQGEMKSFLGKYMSWPSMKEDMVKIYTDEFTEAELKELTAFYNTPLGKKTVQKMPALMARGAEMGQKRVQEHLPELQAAIAAKGAPAAPAAGAAPGAAAAAPTPAVAAPSPAATAASSPKKNP
ncbi:MAG: DUF2059 domain-containing protein [Verrucomicrobiota bacterium]|nr:DUF2059 domain-containing protein [Verrucomicrobiota bacterium]